MDGAPGVPLVDLPLQTKQRGPGERDPGSRELCPQLRPTAEPSAPHRTV